MRITARAQGHIFLVIAVAVAFLWAFGSHSADLMATWLAGHFLELGLPGQVYADTGDIFTMYPPSEWGPFLEDAGYVGPVFPYVYPPMWAKLATFLPTIESFWVFSAFATLGNSIMLALMPLMALRITRSQVHPLLFFGIVALFYGFTHVGTIALAQNQPQILVSFLIVLAIERSRADAQIGAGMAIALAAAIKLYPVAFAVLFLASRQYRAFASFMVTGVALGLFSIYLTGWPLHAQFLNQLKVISDTGLVTGLSFNIHPMLIQLCCADHMIAVMPFEVNHTPEPDAAWHYLVYPEAWKLAARALLLGTVGWLCWLMARVDEQTRFAAVWPLAIVATAMLAPLAWAYYYIPAFAFLPVILERLDKRLAWGLMATIMVPLAGPLVQYFRAVDILPVFFQATATLAMAVMGLAFYLAIGRDHGQRKR